MFLSFPSASHRTVETCLSFVLDVTLTYLSFSTVCPICLVPCLISHRDDDLSVRLPSQTAILTG